jgi:hypothetical protein
VLTITPKTKKKEKHGHRPEFVRINGDWRDSVKISLAKKKPANGWPK